jgi:hypothetical protein
MKKYIVVVALLFIFSSCNFFKSPEDESAKKDSVKDLVVGADKDENGCLASAGYTWSKLNKDCVRVFSGIQLMPFEKKNEEDAVYCAYILFDESKNNAEIFLPNDDKSIILESKSDKKLWSKDNYQLIAKDGYILKKDGKIIFTGDSDFGSKYTGSDDLEPGSNPQDSIQE